MYADRGTCEVPLSQYRRHVPYRSSHFTVGYFRPDNFSFCRIVCTSAQWMLSLVCYLLLRPLLAAAVQLEYVSPLEYGVSVTGPPIIVPGLPAAYMVASLPWVVRPNGSTSPPKRRVVTFLPTEMGKPMCSVDARLQTAVCSALPLVATAAVETSYVDAQAPILAATQDNVTVIGRNGAVLATYVLRSTNFTKLPKLLTVWHLDYNASSGVATVYHSNGTTLCADVVEVRRAADGTWSFDAQTIVRLLYARSTLAFTSPIPYFMQMMVPCEEDMPGLSDGPSSSRPPPLQRALRTALTCEGALPSQTSSDALYRCDAATPPTNDDGHCGYSPSCTRLVGPRGSVARSCPSYVAPGVSYRSPCANNMYASSSQSAFALNTPAFAYGDFCTAPLWSPRFATAVAPSLAYGRGDCGDGRAALLWVVPWQLYSLSTGIELAPSLPLTDRTMGDVVAAVPLTCGSSELIVIRDNIADGSRNAAVVTFVATPTAFGTAFVMQPVTALFILSEPTSPLRVVACHSSGTTMAFLGVDPPTAELKWSGWTIAATVRHPEIDAVYLLTAKGVLVTDETPITVPGTPPFLARLLYLPPLKQMIAIGSSAAGGQPQFCLLAADAVSCVAAPSGIAFISAWVWLPPAISSSVSVASEVLIIGGNATLQRQYCYVRFVLDADELFSAQVVGQCDSLPLPVLSSGLPSALVVHPWLEGVAVYAATTSTHLLFLMFNYTAHLQPSELSTARTVTLLDDDTAIPPPPWVNTTLRVARTFAATPNDAVVVGLVPLPVGTTLVVTNRFIADVSVSRMLTPYVPSHSAFRSPHWCTAANPGVTRGASYYSVSCVDVRQYDPYVVRCEPTSSRRGLVYRGREFRCSVFLAPPATKSTYFLVADASWRQLLYSVSAQSVDVKVGGTLNDFRGIVDTYSTLTAFNVSYCVRRSAPWTCYLAEIDVADLDSLFVPLNSSSRPGDALPAGTPRTSTATATDTPTGTVTSTAASLTETSATGGTFAPANTNGGDSPVSGAPTPEPTSVESLPPLSPGASIPVAVASDSKTLAAVSQSLRLDVYRPAVTSAGELKVSLVDAAAPPSKWATAPTIHVEFTVGPPGVGAFTLGGGETEGVSVERDAVNGLFAISGPASAIRDALPTLRFGFSAAARALVNDTSVTVAFAAAGAPRQIFAARVSDVAEINTPPRVVMGDSGVTGPPVTLAAAGQPFVALLPLAIVDDDRRNESLWYSASQLGGAPLPDWISFDALSASVSGLPPLGTAAKDLVLHVTATDVFGLSASVDTIIRVDRFILVANAQLPDVPVKPGRPLAVPIPRALFSRVTALAGMDAGPATVSDCYVWVVSTSQEAVWATAVVTGGGQLLSLGGTVPATFPMGTTPVELRCSDRAILGAVRVPFRLLAADPPPRLVRGNATTVVALSGSTSAESMLEYFTDDDGDALEMRAARLGGAPLPRWINFDSAGTLHCSPEADVAGSTLSVAISATDGRTTVQLTVYVSVPALVPPALLPRLGPAIIRVEAGASLSEYLSPRRFFSNATAIVRQSLAWVDRPSLDDPELPVWMRFSNNIVSGTNDGEPGNITLLLTGTDGTGASATLPLRVEVYRTLLTVILSWVSFIGGIFGALQAVAPFVLSYHLFFNVVCYGVVYQKSSPLCGASSQRNGKSAARVDSVPPRYRYRDRHPTAAEVRTYLRRSLKELPIPWAVAGVAVKYVSRYAFDLITLQEMPNGDPAPPWLEIGETDIGFTGAALKDGDPASVCVRITDSQGRLLEVSDVSFYSPAAPAGGSSDAAEVLVRPLLRTASSDDGSRSGGGMQKINPLKFPNA